MQTNSVYPRLKRRSSKAKLSFNLKSSLIAGSTILFLLLCTVIAIKKIPEQNPHPVFGHLPPLAMKDGDPHIRALMRTISASESNAKNPYVLLYGGQHTHDLIRHPNTCIPIKTDINEGHCSTAAGRYQFLTSTWQEKASKYHPISSRKHHSTSYNFEPKYQDIVVYRWLKDDHQWDVNILKMLKEERIEDVLVELSGVWTSLGGGIEDNSITPHLPELYRKFLQEELKSVSRNPSITT